MQKEPKTGTSPDAVSRVQTLMLGYLDKVAERLGYVRSGDDLAQAIRDALASEHSEAILAEVRLSVARHPDRFAEVEQRELLRRLSRVFEEALAKSERADRDRRSLLESDPSELDPDPSFRRGALRTAAPRWR